MKTDIRLSNNIQKGTPSFNWPIVSVLLFINAIPGIPAIFILSILGLGLGGMPIQNDFINPVYYQKPLVIFIHGLFGIAFFVTAPFQFSTFLRLRYKQWHRLAGCITIMSGIGIALSGIAMHQMLTPEVQGARFVSLVIFSVLMSLSFLIGFYFAWQKKLASHQRWMNRAIAISATPVTLFLIEVFLELFSGYIDTFGAIKLFLYEYGRLVCVVLNIFVVENFVNKSTCLVASRMSESYK